MKERGMSHLCLWEPTHQKIQKRLFCWGKYGLGLQKSIRLALGHPPRHLKKHLKSEEKKRTLSKIGH